MTPKLTDVFNMKEASVQSLAQRYKISVELAQAVNDFDRQNADVYIAIFHKRWAQWLTDHPDGPTQAAKWNGYVGRIPWPSITKAYLKRYPAKKAELMKMGTDPQGWQKFSDFLYAWSQESNEKGDTVLDLPNGMRWEKLTPGQCAREGDQMQHCGRPMGDGNPMYSLRDENNKPHVTVEIGESGVGDWKMIMQCKGKQNRDPDKKYWPLVLELCKKLNVKFHEDDHRAGGAAPGGFDDDGNHVPYNEDNDVMAWLEKELPA